MTEPGGDMGDGPTVITQSPWVWEAGDYQEKLIRVTISFDPTTRLITDLVVYRDPECLYRTILIGLGQDGTPNTTRTQFPVPAGTRTIKASTAAANGLTTIDQMVGLQITAGF